MDALVFLFFISPVLIYIVGVAIEQRNTRNKLIALREKERKEILEMAEKVSKESTDKSNVIRFRR